MDKQKQGVDAMTQVTRLLVLAVVMVALVLSGCEPRVTEPAVDVPSDVEAAARERLSIETGIPVEEMEVVEAERREWPDSCLGLGEPDEACLMVITPGWRVTIRAEEELYVLRTDEAGDAVRME